jgi:cytochrome c peroxidase
MHDGRLESLEAVLNFYDTGIHQTPNISPILNGDISLSEKEKQQMLAFFQTLTDSTFITKEKFGNPFEH